MSLEEDIQDRGEQMARSVARFLFLSGYLDNEPQIESIRLYPAGPGIPCEMGTFTFKALKEGLDNLYPEWITWDPDYMIYR
jgi:hypothetical protein